MRHKAVERAAAVPVRDGRLGERVCIAVTLRPEQKLNPNNLLSHLNAEGLSKYDMPEFYIELERMPLTSNGKIKKRELNEWLEKGEVKPIPVHWKAPD